ncbi:hypothetical protein MSAN_00970200 [Mycena sanguinolenta]|uniref:DUF6532 domain-containing protein n=1 Tax=Mycena sanguinolenta TaxID=230812 RepID=A0A8H7DD14_9AGAR|nr:hypothetical protein MSAN_00970200 [Mycena sanguinolenta]
MPDATVQNRQPSGALSASNMFNPEEEDEIFGDPDADLSDDVDDPTPSNVMIAQPLVMSTLPISSAAQNQSQFMTPQNLRVFPRASENMSSTDIQLPAPRRLVRRAKPTYTDLSSPHDLSSPTSHLQPPASTARQPLVHRTNIFGPGLHDDRQRPRQSSGGSQKENTVHFETLSEDESGEPARPLKKSRKEPGARSIKSIDSTRIPVIEKAYDYIALNVLTEKDRTWLHGRADLAILVQEAVDWSIVDLKLNPDDFGPVTEEEQDLARCRERIYGTRREFKELARVIITGPDGYEFQKCSSKASKEEQDRVATSNRALVAKLTEKSAFVFADPDDRTVKNSMYQHASIGALICRALFASLLSPGMQYPDFFDDTFPQASEEAVSQHKPTLSLVTLAFAVTAPSWSTPVAIFWAKIFSRKVYKKHSDAELNTLREWRKFTSNPTVIPGDGPVRTAPATFLTRTLQENMYAEARYNLLKDVVAPVPSAEVMDQSDFALNQ